MTATIQRHTDEATLMSFAAGSLPEPLAAVVAAHAAMCAHCRRELRLMESLGVATLESMNAGAPDNVTVLGPRVSTADTVRLGACTPPADVPPTRRPAAHAALPAPIAQVYDLDLATIPWKRLGPGIWHHRLALSPGVQGDLRLMKISAGRKMPSHGHGGSELTLVLDGAYADETGAYRRGDIQDVDDDVEHTPIADARAGCICLIASEKPARFKGLISRIVQPWTGL